MKDSMEQDQRIAKEFSKYRLAPPSPELHDRILGVARAALADSDDELHWADSWLRPFRTYQQEILALVSALMLIVGVVMQLGGSQSVLADSIERLTLMASISASLHRATSMDCTVLKPGAGDESPQFRVRWNAAGVTRVDMDSADNAEQTLWISKGTITLADSADGSVRQAEITSIPTKWQSSMEFPTPKVLAQHLENYGLMQVKGRDGAVPNALLLIGMENRQVVEIVVDTRTCLPTTLKKYLPVSSRTGNERDCLEEVRFQWNKPIPQELLMPGSPVRKQVY